MTKDEKKAAQPAAAANAVPGVMTDREWVVYCDKLAEHGNSARAMRDMRIHRMTLFRYMEKHPEKAAEALASRQLANEDLRDRVLAVGFNGVDVMVVTGKGIERDKAGKPIYQKVIQPVLIQAGLRSSDQNRHRAEDAAERRADRAREDGEADDIEQEISDDADPEGIDIGKKEEPA